jgi:hypothetical protein
MILFENIGIHQKFLYTNYTPKYTILGHRNTPIYTPKYTPKYTVKIHQKYTKITPKIHQSIHQNTPSRNQNIFFKKISDI